LFLHLGGHEGADSADETVVDDGTAIKEKEGDTFLGPPPPSMVLSASFRFYLPLA